MGCQLVMLSVLKNTSTNRFGRHDDGDEDEDEHDDDDDEDDDDDDDDKSG